MLALTRFAYILILGVIAIALVAVFAVVVETGGDKAELPEITPKQIVDYGRFGVIERIDVAGRDVNVTFAASLDTEATFGEPSHRFRATLAEGETMTGLLQAAGLTVGGDTGIRVSGE